MHRPALTAAAMLVSVAACEEMPPGNPNDAGQHWLCGREYANQAWGYQRRGVVLDTAGNIWRYEIKGSPTVLVNPWQPKDITSMNEHELKLRYNGAVTTGTKVPVDEIPRHFPLIGQAANATPAPPKSVGADMGQNLLYCYTYIPAQRTYSQVMLDNKGDLESTNPSPAAKILSGWLDGLLGEVK